MTWDCVSVTQRREPRGHLNFHSQPATDDLMNASLDNLNLIADILRLWPGPLNEKLLSAQFKNSPKNKVGRQVSNGNAFLESSVDLGQLDHGA